MTFLAPIAGIVAAAITAPLLVLLYFLKLRRRPVRISSTLLWTRAVEDLQVNTPFRILRPSILLFLQLAALACLLLAFARPAIQAEGAGVGRMIIVIDASASMDATSQDGNLSRLEYAQDAAIDAVKRFSRSASEGFEAMVISFAARARIVATYSGDIRLLERSIRAVEQTDQEGVVDGALKLIEAQLARFDESAAAQRTRVLLFSDGDILTGAGRASAGLGDADFQFVRVGPAPGAPLDNLGVVALSAKRDFEDPGLLRVFARVLNTAAEPRTAALNYSFNAERIGSQSVEVPPAEENQPGLAPTILELRENRRGVLTVALAGDDELNADDAASVAIAPPSNVTTLVVLESRQRTLAINLLERVLEIATTIPPIIYDIDEYERRRATAALPAHDLLIFDGVAPAAPVDRPALFFGVAPPESRIALVRDDAQEGASRRFSAWQRRHPLMLSVNLDSVIVEGADRITVAESPDDDARLSSTTELAWGPDGPLMIEQELGATRRVITAFKIEESNWPLLPSFVVFVSNLVDRLGVGPGAAAGLSFSTSDVVSAPAPPGARELVLTGPRDFSRTLSTSATGRVSFGPLAIAGLYTLRPALDDHARFPVNLLSERESAIATRDRVEIAGRDLQGAGVEDSAPSEIWHWFVIAALAFLTIEWLAFAWRMRI